MPSPPTRPDEPPTPDREGERAQWETVDEGWGHAAATFAALGEPQNIREYVAMHHRLRVDHGQDVLDLACGAGLAVELATLRGANGAGIDASHRLIAIAQERMPDGDLRVGDMNALPWPDASFDVVTSFRGIWGTTPHALVEAHRVLRPGGRLGVTVWGHLKASPGAWVMAPFALAAQDKVENQAAMVSMGRPGVGEQMLDEAGFVDVERVDLAMVWEFPDPATVATVMASSGPGYEAAQHVGREAFVAQVIESATPHVREGQPLRAELRLVGLLARRPS